MTKSKSKRILSSGDSPRYKKSNNKSLFASKNTYSALNNESDETNNIEKNQIDSQTNQTKFNINMDMDQIKIKPPPPIFIRGLLHFLNSVLIDLIGINNFFVNTTSKNL